jgi:hypothetical protein
MHAPALKQSHLRAADTTRTDTWHATSRADFLCSQELQRRYAPHGSNVLLCIPYLFVACLHVHPSPHKHTEEADSLLHLSGSRHRTPAFYFGGKCAPSGGRDAEVSVKQDSTRLDAAKCIAHVCSMSCTVPCATSSFVTCKVLYCTVLYWYCTWMDKNWSKFELSFNSGIEIAQWKVCVLAVYHN